MRKCIFVLVIVFCVIGGISFFGRLADAVESEGAPVREKAIFAAGCFWGVESSFRKVKGVVSTRAGYTGGYVENPSYEDVCSDETGHVEAVEVEYDPFVVSYQQLLDVFWGIHDPTTFDRQGADIGSHYRSVIFYFDELQEGIAKASKETLQRSGRYQRPIVTQIKPAVRFYPAEGHHQNYLEKKGLPPSKIK